MIGALLTPCNVYSGLKIGWSFNMSITAALLSFAFWRLAEDVAGTRPWQHHSDRIRVGDGGRRRTGGHDQRG